MSESLIQQYRIREEGAYCKSLRLEKIMTLSKQKVPANSCASSRGKTGGASVIRLDWA